jgi:hypothetical protein
MCYHVSFEVKLAKILDVFPGMIVEPQLQKGNILSNATTAKSLRYSS